MGDLAMCLQGFATPLVLVLVAEVMDMGFGLANAVMQKNVSSTRMRDGIKHKLGILGMLILAMFAEVCCMYVSLPIDVPIVGFTTAWIVAMELCSISEILIDMNPEIANAPLFNIFHNALDEVSDTNDNES